MMVLRRHIKLAFCVGVFFLSAFCLFAVGLITLGQAADVIPSILGRKLAVREYARDQGAAFFIGTGFLLASCTTIPL